MKDKRLGSAPMQNEDILEMHKIRLEWFQKKEFSQAQMMIFLSLEFVGTLALAGYSDEFVKKTFNRMYEDFLNHRFRKNIHVKKPKEKE